MNKISLRVALFAPPKLQYFYLILLNSLSEEWQKTIKDERCVMYLHHLCEQHILLLINVWGQWMDLYERSSMSLMAQFPQSIRTPHEWIPPRPTRATSRADPQRYSRCTVIPCRPGRHDFNAAWQREPLTDVSRHPHSTGRVYVWLCDVTQTAMAEDDACARRCRGNGWRNKSKEISSHWESRHALTASTTPTWSRGGPAGGI